MSKLNGLIGVCVLALLCSTAIAQTQIRILVDGEEIPEGTVDTIVIDPVLDEIRITTTQAYAIDVYSEGNSVVISGFGVSPASIVAGASTTISWDTVNAVSCTASGGVGDWANSSISLPSGSKTITTSTEGTHNFTLNCDGSEANDTTSQTISLQVTSPNAIDISSFTANPTTITVGGSTTLSWVTENAVSCTPSGGTGGWSSLSIAPNDLANGSAIITATTEGAIQFALTCKDVGNVSTTSNVTVTVEPEAAETCPIPNLSGSTVNWNNQWETVFPGPTYKTVNIALPRYGYRAIKFNSGQVIDDGRVLGIENTNTTGIIFGTISKCPGDFTNEVPMDCKYKWGLGGSINWSTNNSRYSCELDKDTTYYLNLTFTNGADPEKTTCTSNLCNATMQHRNY